MTLFFRRFIGALALDAGAFEEIESNAAADMQSMLVVAAACVAGGIGAVGLGASSTAQFVAATVMVLTAWMVWAGLIATIGTRVMAEDRTRSDVHELLRVLGFAAAPGVFLVFLAMRTVAPLMAVVVLIWMIAAAVLAVKQALDYRGTARAAAVCTVALLVALSIMAGVALMLTRTVT